MTEANKTGVRVAVGIGVAVAAAFCILVRDLLQDKPYYKTYRWHACAILIASGIIVSLVVWFMSRKQPSASLNSELCPSNGLTPQCPESDGGDEPVDSGQGSAFNKIVVGPVLITLAVIIMIIKPPGNNTSVQAKPVKSSAPVTNALPRASANAAAIPVAPATTAVAAVPAPVASVPTPPATTATEKLVQTDGPLSKPVQFPHLTLQGIIFNPGNPSVIIRGRAYFTGDYVEDAKITKIDSTSITLEYKGQRQVVPIKTI